MMNRVACIALLFAVFVAIHGDRGRGGSGGGGGSWGNGGSGGGGGSWGNGGSGGGGGNRGPGGYRGPGGKCGRGQWVAKLCGNGTNTTLAQSFVTQVQQLITTLQNNGSFGQVLANRAQEIAYIQNSANTALISSNCTGYFSGLKAAKSADQAALQLQRQYQRSADKAFWNITCSLSGVSDSSEEDN